MTETQKLTEELIQLDQMIAQAHELELCIISNLNRRIETAAQLGYITGVLHSSERKLARMESLHPALPQPLSI